MFSIVKVVLTSKKIRLIYYSIIMTAISAIAGFFITLYIARKMGAEASAIYGIVIQTSILFSTIALFGSDISIVKILSIQNNNKQLFCHKSASKIILACIGTSVIISIGIILIEYSFHLFQVPIEYFTSLSLLIFLIIIGRSLVRLLTAIHRGIGRIYTAQTLGVPITNFTILIVLIALSTETIDIVLIVLPIAIWLNVGLLLTSLWRAKGSNTFEKPTILLRDIYKTGTPLMIAGIAFVFVDWLFLIISSHYFGLNITGVLRVCWQLTAIISLSLSAINGVIAPNLAQAAHLGERNKIVQEIKYSITITSILTVPYIVILYAFGTEILSFFGEEFKEYTVLLNILLIGPFVNAITGPIGIALAMSGYHKEILINTVVAALIFCVIAFALSTFYGPTGLAIAYSVTHILRNCLALLSFNKLYHSMK